MFVARAGDSSEAGLYSGSGIGSMGRGRNEYLVAMTLADAFKVGAYDAQTGIFASGSGIGLEADSGKSGNDLQLVTEAVNEFTITGSLVFGY
ncbi:hypothetical protein EVA_09364 [gut metagenome]|uniref:Uncharacterized protein n=1 Tax=gut metagenome TaxID=749906 RepID=J9G6L4_9ZZZZ